ncbi:MAG TPA: TRAP transporter substrate-binding protein [Xanthobacteraceae bacterium]|nr:TRAP transporter substrate-binding protein [Xanthobacteraceae bacterium]
MSLISLANFRKAAVALVAAAAAFPVAAAAREFRVADTQSEDYPTVQALNFLARTIGERSGGRHTIRVFHSRQLGEEKETIEQTRVGAIDLNRTNVAPIGSLVPAANALSLPFLFRSFDHLHKVLDGEIGHEILAGFERHGFVGLTFYDSGARSIYNSVRPVRSLADMKGLRIRVQQSDLMFGMIKALGAEPIELPYGQVSTGLSTRLVDGAENNWPSYVTTGHYKLAPFYTLTEHTMGPEVLVMSMRAWESLSAEDRDLFRDSARKSSMYMRDLWSGLEERSRQQARSSGNTIIANFDRKPFEEAMSAIYTKSVTDADLRQLIERIRQVQ